MRAALACLEAWTRIICASYTIGDMLSLIVAIVHASPTFSATPEWATYWRQIEKHKTIHVIARSQCISGRPQDDQSFDLIFSAKGEITGEVGSDLRLEEDGLLQQTDRMTFRWRAGEGILIDNGKRTWKRMSFPWTSACLTTLGLLAFSHVNVDLPAAILPYMDRNVELDKLTRAWFGSVLDGHESGQRRGLEVGYILRQAGVDSGSTRTIWFDSDTSLISSFEYATRGRLAVDQHWAGSITFKFDEPMPAVVLDPPPGYCTASSALR